MTPVEAWVTTFAAALAGGRSNQEAAELAAYARQQVEQDLRQRVVEGVRRVGVHVPE